MSTKATYILCRGCDFNGVISYRGITLRYHFPSGNIVTGYCNHGWCHSCETNRYIERPLDIGEIEDKIQELQQQKPRGLNCGNDRTLPLKFGSNGLSLSFIHYCGERLNTLTPDENEPRLSLRPLELDLDPEGNLLGSSDAKHSAQVERKRHATSPVQVVRGSFLPARVWRPVVPRLAQTLATTNATWCFPNRKRACY